MEHCHTTSLPLVAAYNGFNNNDNNNNDYGLYSAINCAHGAVTAGNIQQNTDAHSIRTGVNMNASETRLSEHASANNTNGLIRDEANRTNNNVQFNAGEIKSKLDLNTRDIFSVEKSVLKESCDTRELIAKSTADILLEGAKNTAAITLDACKNTNQILAAIAECCCEQKTLTISQGAETRQLINGNTIQALQTELAAAKLQAALAGNGNGNNLR